jgi:membrane-bound serine protease (ClpP class)
MDTPGGLDRAMRDIIQLILASPIPIVTYVAPDGARAASAGTYILYASHVAAMSPATNLGAATPVSIGGLPGSKKSPNEEKDKGKDKDEAPLEDDDTMKRKVINDASAYIKALAEKQGRNAEWAVKAVKEAVSLSAKEALETGVIDFVAADLNDLLKQVNGHEIMLDSKPYVIATTGMNIDRLKPTWRYKVLSVISDPNVAYFLLLLGFYGLVYELANPGVFLPGVAGGISLLLAFYAFQILPVNYSGLALIVLGMILMISEAFVPSFGSLGIGGVVAFAIGSMILMDDEGLKISLSVITATTTVSASIMILVLGRILTIRKKKMVTGDEALVGMVGEALEDFSGEGRVELLGELWLAESSEKIRKGEKVNIISRNGLKLKVQSRREEQ